MAGRRVRMRRGPAVEMLKKVRIPDPERRVEAYPFELSGGMCQRIMIAIALACRPGPADRRTSRPPGSTFTNPGRDHGPDRRGWRAKSGMATIFITHDLALAAEYCESHRGHACRPRRRGPRPPRVLFAHPRHPYAAKLLAATPRRGRRRLPELASIPGGLPESAPRRPASLFATSSAANGAIDELRQKSCRDAEVGDRPRRGLLEPAMTTAIFGHRRARQALRRGRQAPAACGRRREPSPSLAARRSVWWANRAVASPPSFD